MSVGAGGMSADGTADPSAATTPLPPSAVVEALEAVSRTLPAGVLGWSIRDTDDSGTCQDAAAALGAGRATPQ